MITTVHLREALTECQARSEDVPHVFIARNEWASKAGTAAYEV